MLNSGLCSKHKYEECGGAQEKHMALATHKMISTFNIRKEKKTKTIILRDPLILLRLLCILTLIKQLAKAGVSKLSVKGHRVNISGCCSKKQPWTTQMSVAVFQ